MRPRRTIVVVVAAACVAALAAGPDRVDGQAARATIATAAGTGIAGFDGDGGPARAARLRAPVDVAALPGGGFLVVDGENHRVRRVDARGRIATVAGAGPCCDAGGGYAGDGLSATDPAVRLRQPQGVAALPGGGLLIADTGNDVVRRVDAAGRIATAAGVGGEAGYAGDGGPATAALLDAPTAVAPLPDGGFLVADAGNHVVRRVAPDGTIATVAGAGGEPGLAGDRGPATRALLDRPVDVAALPGGGFLVADAGNGRVRRVAADGTIVTLATGLAEPAGVAVGDGGAVLVAEAGGERVVEVRAGGAVRPVAGTGAPGFAGDGGAPLRARLWNPTAVAVDGARLLIADSFNERVRVVEPARAAAAATPVVGRRAAVRPVAGVVRVRPRGERRFRELDRGEGVPLGSELDASRGRARVSFATTRGGRRATAVAEGGRFVVRQPRRRVGGQRPGDLRLSGPLRGCRPARARAASAAEALAQAAKRGARRKRRLRVRAKGRISTTGRYGSAIVRGTRWTVVDRCPPRGRPSTTFRVTEGAVAVRDRGRGRTVVVRAGERYVARAPRRGR